MIFVPVKQASFPGASHNHDLYSVADFLRCETQGFGSNEQIYGLGGHNGLDFSYEEGTDLYSPVDGFAYYKEEVDGSGAYKGYGKYMTIIGTEYKIVYAHLQERLIPDGSVFKGQLIAKGDSTGFSTGHHLHITVKRVDTNGNVLDRDNGHDGAIDPTNLFQWGSMTREEVVDVYVLAFYREPDADELAYWTDKPLANFLKTAIKDRAAFLHAHESN